MIHFSCSAFTEGQPIPVEYTCDGKDQSPPLAWSNIPTNAESLVIICNDPDAPSGDWVHWLIYDIPPDMKGLPAGIPTTETLTYGAKQGMNDFGRVGYGGPCPPKGKAHHYHFKLYVLSKMLGIGPRTTKPTLLKAMQGHILAERQLIGTYQRK